MASLSASVKGAGLLVLLALVSAATGVARGWRADSLALAELKPAHAHALAERDRKSAQVLDLTSENAALKAAIAEQNHAVEVAEVKAAAAREQQVQAQAFASNLARQKDQRIAALEADLADANKTVSDLIDTSWRQHYVQ